MVKGARSDSLGHTSSVSLRLLDNVGLRLLGDVDRADGLLRSTAPGVGSTSVADRAAHCKKKGGLRCSDRRLVVVGASHERTIAVHRWVSIDKWVSLRGNNMVDGHAGSLLLRMHLLTRHVKMVHLRVEHLRSLRLRAVHLGGVHVRLVELRGVHAGAVHLRAVRTCVVGILNIGEAVHVSAVGRVTTASEAVDHIVEALRHGAAHGLSSLMAARASMVVDTVHVAHHGRHGGHDRRALHLQRRHQVSETRVDVGGVRALDVTRELLHAERRLGSSKALLHLSMPTGKLLLSGSSLRVVDSRGRGSKLTERVRCLEDARLRSMDLRVGTSIARWTLLSLVRRRLLQLETTLVLTSGGILGKVCAGRSARVERREASVLRLLDLVAVGFKAVVVARCDLRRGGVLGTAHGVGVVDGATVCSSKLNLISSWWRSRDLSSGETHIGYTSVEGLECRRIRQRIAPDRVDSAGRRQSPALSPSGEIVDARVGSRFYLKYGGDRLS